MVMHQQAEHQEVLEVTKKGALATMETSMKRRLEVIL